jgi:RimJ/RimL family protein N-acetyltransferase
MTLLELPAERLREKSTVVLETERLVLRAPQLEDAKTIAKLANDRRIAENTARIPHPYGLADAKQFIAKAAEANEEVVFAVTLDGAVIGACGVGKIDGVTPEVGYWLGVRYWGKGYATEALRAVIDFAFEEFDYEALHASARVTNPASRRVLEKCGFQRARGFAACARSQARCRRTASGSTASCGPRSRNGAERGASDRVNPHKKVGSLRQHYGLTAPSSRRTLIEPSGSSIRAAGTEVKMPPGQSRRAAPWLAFGPRRSGMSTNDASGAA